jgi:hypothetical protein
MGIIVFITVVLTTLAMIFIYPAMVPKPETGVTDAAFVTVPKELDGNLKLALVYTGLLNEEQGFEDLNASKVKVIITRSDYTKEEFRLSGTVKPYGKIVIDIPDDSIFFHILYEDGEEEYMIKGPTSIGIREETE